MNKRRAMIRCSPQTETSDVSLQHASGSGNLAHRHHTSRRPLQQI